MATYKRPGVYVEETLLPQQIESLGSATAIGAFLGTASRGPSEATLVTSWTDFVRKFGNLDANYRLGFAMYQFFANGGSAAYVSRITGTGAATASVTLTDRAATPLATLRLSAINPGTWANSSNSSTGLSAEIKDNGTTNRFDLLVYQGGSSTPGSANVVERFTDLSMDVNDSRYVERVVNNGSAYVKATDLNSATASPADRPDAAGVKTFATGADGTAAPSDYVSALTLGNAKAAFDTVINNLVLNIPDTVDMSDVNAATVLKAAGDYSEARGDVFVVVDVTANTPDAASAASFAASLTASASPNGSRMAVYYPYVVLADPLGPTGTTRALPPGGAIVGLYLRTDVTEGVQKTPAGVGTTLTNVVAPAVKLSSSNLDALNTATPPVNAIRSVPGAGVCVLGGRTLRTQYADRWINVRRSLMYIQKSLTELTQFAVFRNNDERLWDELRTTATAFLNEFWQQGGLRGTSAEAAFFVKCDGTINTNSVIQNGEVRLEVGVALQTPAEFVVIKIGQFEGGATATSDI